MFTKSETDMGISENVSAYEISRQSIIPSKIQINLQTKRTT